MCAPHSSKRGHHHSFTGTLTCSRKITAFEEGLRGYTLRQASVRQRLFTEFAQQWHDVPTFIALTDWGLADEEIVAVDNTE